MLVLEEAVEAGPRKEPMESSKKLLLLPLTLALLVGCILLDNGLLEEKDNIILSALHIAQRCVLPVSFTVDLLWQ